MIPYVLLMFVPLLFSFIAFSASFTEYNGKWSVKIGGSREILNHSCLIPVFFFMFIALLALRDESIGRDLANYKHYFKYYSSVDIKNIFEDKVDILYWLLNWLVGKITDDYQVFLAIVAVITVLPVAKVYSEDRQHGFLKIVLFMNMTTFIMLFSGLRQSIAIAMGVVAYEFVKRKKPLLFLLFAAIALGFHHTGFMILPFYPLYHITFKKRHLWFVIPSVLLVFIFNKPIFTWATDLLNSFLDDRYDATIRDTGAYTMLILLILFIIFAYVMPDEHKKDKELLGLRNFLLVSVILQCFAPVHALAMRMNYYYIIFIPVLIPKTLTNVKSNLKDVAWIAKGVMLGFFVIYYLVETYTHCQTGIDALDTYPYKFFWEI